MIYDSTLLQQGQQYRYKQRQTLIYSHPSWTARNTKTFVFRTLRGAWKRLSRNQLDHVDAVEQMREGQTE